MSSGLYSGASGLALGVGLYQRVAGLWSGAPGLITGDVASLYLDFLAGAPLDSRITFTRGTNATLVDSTGKIVYAPANLLLRSQTFDNAGAWTLEGSTLSSGQTAPDGTATAYLFTATAPSGNRRITQVISQVVSVSYVRSIWIRRVTGTGAINLRSPTGSDVDITSQISATWNRIAVSGTATGASNFILAFSVTGDAIEIWGAQVEPVTYQTTPATYVATTTSAYYGPRFDYDPVTLAAKGLLIEEARTNLLLYSQDWNTAAWSKPSVTVTNNSITAPDGTLTGNKLLTSGATTITQASSSTATSQTFSVYVKLGSSATAANNFIVRNSTTAVNLLGVAINYTTGAIVYTVGSSGASVVAAGNGWWRLTLSVTSGITIGNTLIVYTGFTGGGTNGDFLYAWGAQLEAGAFATSYIPTVASQVTRNADNAAMTGTNFTSWYNATQGTFVSNFDKYSASSRGVVLCAGDTIGATGSDITIDGQNNGFVRAFIENVGNLEMLNATLATYTANTPIKGAIAYATNDAIGAAAGALGTVDTSVVVPTLNALQIGANRNTVGPAAAFLNGHIRFITYYNTRLPNATLQALTA